MDQTDVMYEHSQKRLFNATGILNVINVDTQESECIGRKTNTKADFVFWEVVEQPDLSKDIIAQVLDDEPLANSQNCALVITNFFYTVGMLN
eukprot:9977592-Ditylum_brightwellii.AAC.1